LQKSGISGNAQAIEEFPQLPRQLQKHQAFPEMPRQLGKLIHLFSEYFFNLLETAKHQEKAT